MADRTVVVNILLFLLYQNIVVLASGQKLGISIIDPKPKNIYVIEKEPSDIQNTTCVAKDLNITHPRHPTRFLFYRLNDFGIAIESNPLVANNVFKFSNKSSENGRVLSGSMIVQNVSAVDGANYQCWAMPDAFSSDGGISRQARHGFILLIIPRSDLPEIYVNVTQIDAKFDDVISLICNLTKKGPLSTKLTRMEWLKNGEVIYKVTQPEENNFSIVRKITKAEQGGTYTCRLTSVLRTVKTYVLSKDIVVTVAPKTVAFDLEDNEIIRKKGEEVVLECDVKGNPIKVEWQRENTSGNRTAITNARYDIRSETPYSGFELVINITNYDDRGDFWCCVKDDKTGTDTICKKFTLRIKDPLGYLWPLLGIIAEVIVLIIIIAVYESCRKKKDDSFDRTDGQVDVSYVVSEDGDKGALRLRKNTGQ